MTDYELLYARQRDVCGAPASEFVDLVESLAGPLEVLDLGCGQGRDALMAARAGHRVLGVDASPTGVKQLLAAAATEGLAVRGTVSDVRVFRPTRRFDLVFLDRVLHMLPREADRLRVLRRACAHTAPGGHLLLADTPSNLPAFRACIAGLRVRWDVVLQKRGLLFVKRVGRRAAG